MDTDKFIVVLWVLFLFLEPISAILMALVVLFVELFDIEV